MRSFKQTFMKAVKEVQPAYPEARIACGPRCVTLYPSATSAPTTEQTRNVAERLNAASLVEHDGHWLEVMWESGRVKAYGSLDDYSLADARAHLAGEASQDECPACRYDERNRELHGSGKGQ